MSNKYLIVDKEVLPSAFEKVINAKELLISGEYEEVTEAVKAAGVSRSTFYKYKDKVFKFSEKNLSRKIILNFMLKHKQGVLADVLQLLSVKGGNILTINQEIPINDIASVNITFEFQSISESMDDLIDDLKNVEGVRDVSILAME